MIRQSLEVGRKRPLTSLLSATVLGAVGYAHAVEARTNQRVFAYHNTAALNSNTDNASLEPPLELPREYDGHVIGAYWRERPVSVATRLAQILRLLGPRLGAFWWDFKIREGSIQQQLEHAAKLRQALTELGPAFVKAGQQLSIRPDLVPPTVLKELQLLCDSVEPISDAIAKEEIRTQLGVDSLEEVFLNGELTLVASASLGQVYKGKLIKHQKIGSKKLQQHPEVAVKVQRPDMYRRITNQMPYHEKLIGSFCRGSYMELDYDHEAKNQLFFQRELAKRASLKVKVPDVYTEYTTQRVLVTEWIDGVKLADAPQEKLRSLIPVGVELFLTQLLDMGTFHADPHPGNLYVTNDVGKEKGVLCLLDYGLCAEVDEKARQSLTSAIFHLLTGDFDSLISEDAKQLGFLPHDMDTRELQPILQKILTEGLLES
eukprot:scaffold16738_cov47-Attheya_sp.AAC.1